MLIMRLISGAYEQFLAEAFDPQNTSPRILPASPEIIAGFDIEPLPKGSVKVGQQCVICQYDLCSDDKCITIACGHCFHDTCLLPWLRCHNTCPQCRYQLLTTDPAHNQTLLEMRSELDEKHTPPRIPAHFASNRRLTRRRSFDPGQMTMSIGNRTLRISPERRRGGLVHNTTYSLRRAG